MRQLVLPLAVLAALGAAPFAGADAFVLSLLARAMILAMAAVALSLLVGGAGLVSLGQAAMLGAGSYVVATLDLHGVTNAALVAPTALAAGAGLALLTGAVSLRTSGVHFIMITLAFGQMAFFTAASVSALGGDDGYSLAARTDWFGVPILDNPKAFHALCLASLVATWLLCSALLDSRFGRVLQAARENPARVQALGFSPYPYRLVAYTIAGGITGLAGALLANANAFVSPATLSWGRSGELLFIVILGGAGRLYGAILGALAVVALEEYLSQWFDYWRLIYGPMLVLSVLFLRQGLAGLAGGTAARPRAPPRLPKRADA